jgi:guanosine-3',5'-bis(diphosphate) 3'-pyrophosphohydrolase
MSASTVRVTIHDIEKGKLVLKTNLVLILDAAAFAAEKHRHQRRKDALASPYINHPLALADILAREGGVEDEAVIAAALLHDTIEDTETKSEELEARFGKRVAAIVVEVTDDKSLPKTERKRLQVVKAKSKSKRAKLVKLADKIANLRDMNSAPPADWSEERKTEYFRWAREVVAGLRGINASLEAAFDEEYGRGMGGQA